MALYIDSFQPLLDLITDEIDCKYNTVLKGLALIGLFYVTKKAFQLSLELFSTTKTYVGSRCCKQSFKQFGDWAVVLICDDLGFEFACLLAAEEINLILIDYDSRVHDVRQHMEMKFKIKCEVITFSPANVNFAADNLKDHACNKNIGVLINNTDISYPDHSFQSIENLKEMISVNVEAFTMITNTVLPKMLERNAGAIISVSSWSCKFPKLISSYYASTKAYMDCYMERLQYVHRRTNLIFTCLTPLNISTPNKHSLFWPIMCPYFNPTPHQYAKRAILTVGWSKRPFGYVPHLFQSWFLQILPNCTWIRSCFLT